MSFNRDRLGEGGGDPCGDCNQNKRGNLGMVRSFISYIQHEAPIVQKMDNAMTELITKACFKRRATARL